MVSKRLGLADVNAKRDRVEAPNQDAWGTPAVLGVKPAIEDVDAQIFLAFHCAIAEDRIESNKIHKGS
jgi:hypothetical protein